MATGAGTATIDFGASPVYHLAAEMVVGGQSGVTAGTHVEFFFMHGDSTVGDNDADAHEAAATFIILTGRAVSGTEIGVKAEVNGMLVSGTFKVHYAWSN